MTDGPSVVVPVRDEAAAIGRLLESLHRQTLPPKEVIVVDGGSRDDTVGTALRWGDRLPLHVVKAGPAFPGRTRNLGIDAARNQWIALVDCGGHADARWLERLCSRAEADAGDVEVVWGRYDPLVLSRKQRWIAAVITPSLIKDQLGSWRGKSVTSCLLLREVWQRAGGFPEDLRSGEDLVFFKRLRAAGAKEVCEPNAIVYWQIPRDLGAMFNRSRTYSSSGIQAGLWKEWQLSVFRNWFLLAAMGIGGLVNWRILLLVPLLIGTRGAKIIWRHRGDDSIGLRFRPPDVFGVAIALLVSDLATVCGAWDWLMGAY